jgi:hypothetical protein
MIGGKQIDSREVDFRMPSPRDTDSVANMEWWNSS